MAPVWHRGNGPAKQGASRYWFCCLAASLVIRNLRGAVVGPLDLIVEPGTCAAITGPSGAGKSLFLRMIADLDPNEGEVGLGAMDRATTPAPTWRRAVSYVAAEPGWWADTPGAHLSPAARPAAEAIAPRLGLAPALFDRPIALLSTGERQRFGLVRALCQGPPALLLDEPTSALDDVSTAQVEALLRELLAASLVLILVSHDRALADRLGTRRHELAAGRLTAP